MTDKQLNQGALMRENRQLRVSLDALLTAIENSNAQVDTAAARESMPDQPGERDPIVPPGQRDGNGQA